MSKTLQKVAFDMGGRTGCAYGESWSSCYDFWHNFLSELRVQRICNDKNNANECMPDYEFMPFDEHAHYYNYGTNKISVVLTDGTIIRPYGILNDSTKTSGPIVMIDTNGKKGPNKACYDVFSFAIYNEDGKYKFNTSLQDALTDSSKPCDSESLKNFRDIDKW